MKKFITIQLTALVLLLFGATAQAAEHTYTVPLEESSPNDSEPDEHDARNKGKRMPPRPILCVISESEGVTISTVSVDEIDTFELYNTDGFCLGSFTDAGSFVTTIYTLDATTVELRFVTADHTYRGYLSLE